MTGNLPINLHDLLRQRTIEGERVEYKAGWNPQSVLHTICAFANDFHNLGGGYVVLGVEEHDGQRLLPPAASIYHRSYEEREPVEGISIGARSPYVTSLIRRLERDDGHRMISNLSYRAPPVEALQSSVLVRCPGQTQTSDS